jgi:hypothetical protein
MNYSEIGNFIFLQFSGLLTNVKLFHLQTKSYALHKASDALYDAIASDFDLLMETFSGKYGRITLESEDMKVSSTTKDGMNKYLVSFLSYLDSLQSDLNSDTKNNNSDIITVVDSVKTSINKYRYLSELQ